MQREDVLLPYPAKFYLNKACPASRHLDRQYELASIEGVQVQRGQDPCQATGDEGDGVLHLLSVGDRVGIKDVVRVGRDYRFHPSSRRPGVA